MSHHQVQIEKPDLQEKGAEGQVLDRRVYCQLQVFSGAGDTDSLVNQLKQTGLDSVLYQDINNPKGVGVLFIVEDPSEFAEKIRDLYLSEPFSQLEHKPEYTMIGRTYSSGREVELEDWMLEKAKRYALNPETPWAVWYPIRRKPEFELLEKKDQGKILFEHAMIGRSFGEAGFASDIRLACYGLDKNDNEFVLGILGKELYPLSRLVQDMRKTEQTAKYIDSLGPFFVGKVIWQSS